MTVHCPVWPFFIFFFTLAGASAMRPSSVQRLRRGVYEENLASYRVEFAKLRQKEKKGSSVLLSVQLDKTKELEALLAKRKAAYAATNFLKGYTIQVYMGSSRTAALKMQELASSVQSTYAPEINYRQPSYTVRFGFFSSRIEAYFVYLALVKKLPDAMIRPFLFSRKV